MPFVQAELDGIKDAQSAAGVIGLPAPQVVGGLMLMWNHCRAKRVDAVSQLHIEGFFCSSAPRLIEALVAFNFIEAAGKDRWHVKGLNRYDQLSDAEREARRKGGLAAKGNLRRGNVQPSLFPGSQPGDSPAAPGSALPEKGRLVPAPLPDTRYPIPDTREKTHTKSPASRAGAREVDVARRVFTYWQDHFVAAEDRKPAHLLDAKSQRLLVARQREGSTEPELLRVVDGACAEIDARRGEKSGFSRANNVKISQLYRDADSVRSFLRWAPLERAIQ
jgi:hypothetical protein